MKRNESKVIALRDYTARKVLLVFALILTTYLALLPIWQRLVE